MTRLSLGRLRDAAQSVLDAERADRDARNGLGHPGHPHDRVLALPGQMFSSPATDCAACGGAEYGTDDALRRAFGDLREALGQERLPWE
jgi:hypothetical protein